MEPITGIIGKKVADGVFESAKKWLTPNSELKKENEALKAQVEILKAQVDDKAEFKRQRAELECRPEDDNIYWAKDGSGAAFCPLCICGSEKLFTPLTHGTSEGSYYCRLHEHYFETRDLRERRRNNQSQRRSHRARHPQGWMMR